MKTISLRGLSRDAPALTEDVLVLHDRRIIGMYSPTVTEALMDDVAKKAIEPDGIKAKRGKLTKGLGDLPGEEPKPTLARDPYRSFNPAPKPGKSK